MPLLTDDEIQTGREDENEHIKPKPNHISRISRMHVVQGGILQTQKKYQKH